MRAARSLGALVVVALAIGAAFLAVHRAEVGTKTAVGDPGDRARSIIETFRSGEHLYVGPEMSSLLTPDQVEQVAAAAEAADPPVYVALVDSHLVAGYHGTHHLLAQLLEGVGEEAVYLVWDGQPRTGYSMTPPQLSGYLSSEMTGKNDLALLRFIDAVESEVTRVEPGERFDYWGGTGGGIAAGLLMVGLGYTLVMLVVGTFRAVAGSSFRLPGRWRDFFWGGA